MEPHHAGTRRDAHLLPTGTGREAPCAYGCPSRDGHPREGNTHGRLPGRSRRPLPPTARPGTSAPAPRVPVPALGRQLHPDAGHPPPDYRRMVASPAGTDAQGLLPERGERHRARLQLPGIRPMVPATPGSTRHERETGLLAVLPVRLPRTVACREPLQDQRERAAGMRPHAADEPAKRPRVEPFLPGTLGHAFRGVPVRLPNPADEIRRASRLRRGGVLHGQADIRAAPHDGLPDDTAARPHRSGRQPFCRHGGADVPEHPAPVGQQPSAGHDRQLPGRKTCKRHRPARPFRVRPGRHAHAARRA